MVVSFPSPLRGEGDFQNEQKPVSIRKSGEGVRDQYTLFPPHPEFLTLIFRAEIHPSPLKGEGRRMPLRFFAMAQKDGGVKELAVVLSVNEGSH